MTSVALTFRVDADFVSEVDRLARSYGVSRSDYIRRAVEEKNARALAERVAFLSKKLSARHKRLNEDMEGSLGDGLGGR